MRADGPQPPRHKIKPQGRAPAGGAALRRTALYLLRGGGGPAALRAGRKGVCKDEDEQGRKDRQPEQADGDEAPFSIFCTAV